MKNAKMKKAVVALSLAAVLGLGGTLAYLNEVTETKTNTFSTNDNTVEGEVVETNWDETGREQAENYVPGQVIAKDPTVALEADSEGAWAAMALDFKDSEGRIISYDKFQAYAAHNGPNASWTLIAKTAEGSELYAYNTALTAGTAATPIFTEMTVNGGITTVTDITTTDHYTLVTEYDADRNVVSENLTKVEGTPVENVTYYDADGNVIGQLGTDNATKLPTFTIDVTGYAVQSANVDQATAIAELIKLANQGVTDAKKIYHAV